MIILFVVKYPDHAMQSSYTTQYTHRLVLAPIIKTLSKGAENGEVK